jgi:aminopeptidase N
MLQLPYDEILAQEELILDAASFDAAYDTIITSFVKKYESELITHYQQHHLINNSGSRALKNKILNYLIQAKQSNAVILAFEQFNTAKNMTDKIAALNYLCHTEGREKETALSIFFEKWSKDAVVFNKWLSVQASSSLKNTFDTVKKLASNSAFDLTNPNNIYSLHSVLSYNYSAMQSQTDGSTFVWLCDEILKIDKMNPQVAARVCGGFNFIKKYPENLKVLAQKEIARVLAVPELSKNSRELLEGCL